MESSSDESSIEDSSLVEPSSDEDNPEVVKKRGDNTSKGLGDEDGGVQLGDEERSFKPVWKDDAGEGYQGVGLYLQRNEKGDVIEIWKNWLLKPG